MSMDTSPGYCVTNDGKKKQSTPVDLSYYKANVEETTPEDDTRRTESSSTAPRLHNVNGVAKINNSLQEKSQKLSKRKLFPTQLTISNVDSEKKRKLDVKIKNNGLQSPMKPLLTERQQLVLLLGNTNNHHDNHYQSNVPSFTKIKSKKGKINNHIYRRNKRGETPLHIAAIKNDVNAIKKLIREGVDVQVKDYAGWTALHEACNHGNMSTAKLLLERKAEVNEPGFEGDTPLHDAVVNNHVEIVEMLLDFGADSNRSNARDATPIDLIHSEEMNQVFLARGLRTSFTMSNENKKLNKNNKVLGEDSNTDDPQRINETSSKAVCGENERVENAVVQEEIKSSEISSNEKTSAQNDIENNSVIRKLALEKDVLSPVSRSLISNVAQESSNSEEILSNGPLCTNNKDDEQIPSKNSEKQSLIDKFEKEQSIKNSLINSPIKISPKEDAVNHSLNQGLSKNFEKPSPVKSSEKHSVVKHSLNQDANICSDEQSVIRKLLVSKERSDQYNRTGSILCNEIRRKETQGESKMEKPVMYICKLTPGGHSSEEFTVETTTINQVSLADEDKKESSVNISPSQSSIGTLHRRYGGFKDVSGATKNNQASIITSLLQSITSTGLVRVPESCGDNPSLQKQPPTPGNQTSTLVTSKNTERVVEQSRKSDEQKRVSSTLVSKKHNSTKTTVVSNEAVQLTVRDTPTNTCLVDDGHSTTSSQTNATLYTSNPKLCVTVKDTPKNETPVVKPVNKSTTTCNTRLTTKAPSSVVTDRVTTRYQNNQRNTMSGPNSDQATLGCRKPTTTWKSLFSKNKRKLSEIKIPFYDEFLTNTKNYDLSSNKDTINPLTQAIGNSFKEMLILRQKKSRVDLIKKQKSELDKLQICMEQEIIRFNSKKASFSQGNTVPPGVCDILRWQSMTSQQLNIEKKKLYQKRFSAECHKTLSTNNEVIVEKYNKLKTLMTTRHTNEVQALDAVAKRELESLC